MEQEIKTVAELFAFVPPFVEVVSGLFIIIGGIWGLRLAKRRLDTFEKQVSASQEQVKTGQEQLFTDMLERGVELLAGESVTLRIAGARLLDNLAETANQDQTKLIVDLLQDYVRAKAAKQKIDLNELGDRNDIVLTMKFLQRFKRKGIEATGGTNFRNLDLRALDLSGYIWRDLYLSTSDLTETNLSKAELANSTFMGVVMVNGTLDGSNLKGSDFSFATLPGTSLKDVDFSGVNLLKVKGLEQSQFDNIIYERDKPPVGIPDHLTLPEDRAYIWEGEKRWFVQSDKGWSGQDVDNRQSLARILEDHYKRELS